MFKSILANEMTAYLELREMSVSEGFVAHDRRILVTLDCHLISSGFCSKELTEDVLGSWISTLSGKSKTINTKVGTVRGFVKGDIMTYIEKEISYADYVRLRESVNWNNFFKEQTEKCLKNTLYSIEVIDDNTIIGMGRLIGDVMYYMMVDIIVEPSYQGKGIGSNIVNK